MCSYSACFHDGVTLSFHYTRHPCFRPAAAVLPHRHVLYVAHPHGAAVHRPRDPAARGRARRERLRRQVVRRVRAPGGRLPDDRPLDQRLAPGRVHVQSEVSQGEAVEVWCITSHYRCIVIANRLLKWEVKTLTKF